MSSALPHELILEWLYDSVCVCLSGEGLGQGMMGWRISSVLESDSRRQSVPKWLCNLPAHLHIFCARGDTRVSLTFSPNFTGIFITVDKTALLEPYSSLEDSARLHPDWISLISQQQKLHSKVVNLVSKFKPEDQVLVFVSPSDRVAQLYPQTVEFFFHPLLRLSGIGWR
jgi:hypothetical protein